MNDAEILAAVTDAVKTSVKDQVLETLGEYFEAHQQEPEPREHGANCPTCKKMINSTAQCQTVP